MSIKKNMESKKNLVLVGMMGSGKSTIGSLLAEKLGLQFLDIDKLIEQEENSTISNIFEKKGENYFRKIEEKITIKMLESSDKVISLGGGAFINKNIQKVVLKNHISVWLKWKSSTLIKRIKDNKKRPLATSLNEKKLKELIINRSIMYNKANLKIDCDNLNKNEIVDKITLNYEKF